MAIYVSRVDLYVHAENRQQAEQRVRQLERESLSFPSEFLRYVNHPQRLEQDGTLAPAERAKEDLPHKSPGEGHAFVHVGGEKVVREDYITAVRVWPATEGEQEISVPVYTTGGQLFETHGAEAARLLETLGLQEMLAGCPKGGENT